LDLFDYISEDQSSLSLLVKDKTYDKIISHLDEFIKNISEEKDNQLLLQTISKCYLKYQDSIKNGNGNSIFELNIKLLMAMLIDQKLEYNKL
jgi:hypothetical protein